MKKILFLCIAYISSCVTIVSAEQNAKYKTNMLPAGEGGNNSSVTVLGKNGDASAQVTGFLEWIRDSIDALLPLVAIGVFLFVGIRLGLARWNPEEFKKSWIQFIYAVVGIFVVSAAWAAVKLIQGINIF